MCGSIGAVNDDAILDAVEEYLLEAPIIDIASFERHGAHRSWRLILLGGVGVLAKPEDVIDDGRAVVGKEVGAWLIARELGWPDLVAATVLRSLDSFENPGNAVDASLQVLWPDVLPDADRNMFSDDDVWRAAVFDFLIGHTDRGGHNWLAVPANAPQPSLKLNDHGFGFAAGIMPPTSSFYEMKRGEQIPEPWLEGVRRLRSPRQGASLSNALGGDALRSVFERAEHILTSGALDV